MFAFPESFPLWTLVPSTILLSIATGAAFLRIWRPGKVTKQDLLRSINLLVLGVALFVAGIGGVKDLWSLNLEKLNAMGYVGSIGALVIYDCIWLFIRIVVYWASGRADFARAD